MFWNLFSSRKQSRTRAVRSARPTLEPLEDRTVPDAFDVGSYIAQVQQGASLQVQQVENEKSAVLDRLADILLASRLVLGAQQNQLNRLGAQAQQQTVDALVGLQGIKNGLEQQRQDVINQIMEQRNAQVQKNVQDLNLTISQLQQQGPSLGLTPQQIQQFVQARTQQIIDQAQAFDKQASAIAQQVAQVEQFLNVQDVVAVQNLLRTQAAIQQYMQQLVVFEQAKESQAYQATVQALEHLQLQENHILAEAQDAVDAAEARAALDQAEETPSPEDDAADEAALERDSAASQQETALENTEGAEAAADEQAQIGIGSSVLQQGEQMGVDLSRFEGCLNGTESCFGAAGTARD